MPNPYDTSNPADPVRAFAGREDELRRIRSSVESVLAGHVRHVFVEGEWGIGKTSLLFKLRPELQEQGHVINEVLTDGPNQAAWFYNALFAELLEARPDGLTAEQLPDPDFHDPRRIRTFLKTAWDGLSTKYKVVVVMLDEVDRAKPSFLLEVRDIFQRLSQEGARYMLVFAGRQLPVQGSEAADPVGRFFNPRIVLSAFDEAASIEAIRKPVRYGPFSFTDDAARLIHQRASGHPYFLKFICSEVFDAAGGGGEIDLAKLEELWPRIEARLADARFKNSFERLPEGEQNTLLHASRLGPRFEARQLRPVIEKSLDTFLKRLGERQLIRNVDRGVYELYHPLFRTYLESIADARKLAPSSINIPDGRPLHGRDEIEERIAQASVRLRIVDQHFRGRAVSFLEAARRHVEIRILMGEDPQWSETKRRLEDLEQALQRQIQVRAWPDKSEKRPIPWHYRCLMCDDKIWRSDHSLEGIGKKSAYLTEDSSNRKQHESDFKKWWNMSKQIFPTE